MYRRKIPILIITLVIKAGLASVGSLAVSRLFELSSPYLVIFAALLGITPSFYRGLKVGLQNISVTVLGGFLSLLLVGIFGIDQAYVFIPLGVMVLLGSCYLLGLMDQFPLGVFTFIIMGFVHPEGLWETGLRRFGAIAIGVGVATAVNYLASLFRYRSLYTAQLRHILGELIEVYGRVDDLFREGDAEGLEDEDKNFHLLFRQIGVFRDELADLKSELRMRRRSGGLTYNSIIWLAKTVEKVEMVSHYLYDLISTGPGLINSGELAGEKKKKIERELSCLLKRLTEALSELRSAGAGENLRRKAGKLKEDFRSRSELEDSGLSSQLISLWESVYALRLEMIKLFEYMADYLI